MLEFWCNPFKHWYCGPIFMGMFAPKWARGPHNLALFSHLWPLHDWVSSVVFKCFGMIRLLCYVLHVFHFCFVLFFRGWAWLRLLSPSLLMFWKPLVRLRYLRLNLLLVVKIQHCPLKKKAVFFFSGVLLPLFALCLLQNQDLPGLFWSTYVALSLGPTAFVFTLVCFCSE